ncbi:branched-chain amino acid ABC transporter permease [Paraburkholderia elongata]|uniref:Branched-chain amino acid ABC transporter permease n=1 Tax=Paraburkholderia elongata TaxID=2675747 RepID=A0A972NW63_9BURK|nr:branched-chain amino acid ABC transporter permease [Paraburkholderia elongata]NPT54919.1 branched-chain amino acid ABC transporter permease [Paraburkholderia elongata]NPT60948.1 branched-chain amino acid ABC transporter permease [Paraburkholderia elongata]
MTTIVTLLFNGLSYGALLFVMAVGLSVTMGMMQFMNLAQVSFSMLGGYVMVSAMNVLGIPFLASLPLAFVAVGAFSAVLEWLVLRHFYEADDLTQVLLTLGLVFMSISSVAFIWGPSFRPVSVPAWLSGQAHVFGLDLERYRIFLIVAGVLIAMAMVLGIESTRFGAKVRACVDNRRAASGCGMNTGAVFSLTFALGGGLAGLGGALSANLLSLDPNFPLRYLVYVLIVVSVGGTGNIFGTLLAAVLIGVADVVGKYYLPEAAGLSIYVLTVLVMLWRPQGLLGKKV